MPDLSAAVSDPESKRELNRAIFDRIAGKYHVTTRALSLGRDIAWKRDLVRQLPDTNPNRCLDLATGTGDIAQLLAERYPDAEIVGLDLSENMVALAKQRLSGERFQFHRGDICNLPFPDEFAGVITGGYALRNVPDLDLALREIHRVLEPGGTAAFLDFVQPPPGLRRAFNHALLHVWGGLVGLIMHGRPWIYRYIPVSLAGYPDPAALREKFQRAGFELRSRRTFFFGIVERVELVRL